MYFVLPSDALNLSSPKVCELELKDNKNVNKNVDGIGKTQAPDGKKKWYGASSSRSCSEHINLKGIEATGKGTTNRIITQPMSFSGPDQTTVKTALARCRGNGCVAPKKKGAI